jgi:hypothetical protein
MNDTSGSQAHCGRPRSPLLVEPGLLIAIMVIERELLPLFVCTLTP